MGLSLDGIASGLDTAALISSQMAVEAIPQTLLKNQVAKTETKIVDLQSLNARMASLATLATTSLAPDALKTYSASASASGVSATTTAAATAGALDITVTKLAQAQTSVTAAMTEWPQNPPVLTVVSSTGVKTTVTATSGSMEAVAAAINASGAGVTATRVAAGVDGSGVQQYRLQLTSSPSGAASAFSLYNGSTAEVNAGTAPNLLTAAGAATIRSAQDASITLWAGTSAEQVVTSSSNSFANLMPGVSITAAAASTTPVTVTIARDPAKATAVVQSLVDAISLSLGLIDSKSATGTGTGTDGKSVTTLGSFTSDSTIRTLRQTLMTAVSGAVDGKSPSEIGISFDKNGSIEFDAEKFAAALASDPKKVEAVFAAIATRVAATANAASDKTTGLLTTKITGAESSVKNMTTQVEAWDTRLATREATLKSTYVALEVSMSKMNAISKYLTSQIAAIDASTAAASK